MTGIVYRCYDAGGRLLYIGSTMNSIAARLQQHRYVNRTAGKSAWVNDVTRCDVDTYPSWEEALLAESALILALRPLANHQRGSVENTRRCLAWSLNNDGLLWHLPEAAS